LKLERDDYIVQGIPWKIREVATISVVDDCFGYCDFDQHIIFILDASPVEEKLDTLVHETVHIIVYGWDRADLLQEDCVRVIASTLADTFSRNCIEFF
jgi:hypothetical protein